MRNAQGVTAVGKMTDTMRSEDVANVGRVHVTYAYIDAVMYICTLLFSLFRLQGGGSRGLQGTSTNFTAVFLPSCSNPKHLQPLICAVFSAFRLLE